MTATVPPAIPPSADVEALADSLSASANALHKRIMAAIRKNAATAGDAMSHAEAQALFEQEIALRQHANALYTDVTRHATAGLAGPVRDLLALAALAGERIGRIERTKALAGIAAARPEALVPALEDLKDHLAELPPTTPETAKTPSLSTGSGHTMET